MSTQAATPRSPRFVREFHREEYGLQPARILLAEDDRDLRLLLATELRKQGYVVEEAASGHGLLELLANMALRNETFDLIVTDIRMPGLTGLSIVEGLRHGLTEGTSSTPVILITAFGDEETHAEARRLGAVIFDKPFDIGEFRDCVARLVL
jgi:DNA-binding response OmpR family regulator